MDTAQRPLLDPHPAWPGASTRGSLLLPLPAAAFADLPARIEVEGAWLQRKDEFHITLLDTALATRLGHILDEGALRDAFVAQDWALDALGPLWLLREQAQGASALSTVVAMVDLPAMGRFRQALATEAGVAVPEAPAHVTLWTSQAGRGIGLPDQACFRALRVRRLVSMPPG